MLTTDASLISRKEAPISLQRDAIKKGVLAIFEPPACAANDLCLQANAGFLVARLL